MQSLLSNAAKSSTLSMLIPPATSTMLFFPQVSQCPVFLFRCSLTVSTSSHSSPSCTRIKRQGVQFTRTMSERALPTVAALLSQEPRAHQHRPKASPEARAAVVHIILPEATRTLEVRGRHQEHPTRIPEVRGRHQEHPTRNPEALPPICSLRCSTRSSGASCTPEDETCSTDRRCSRS